VNIAKWMEFVTENKNENCIIVLCGNKLDLERYDIFLKFSSSRQVAFSQGEKFAKEHKVLFYEISAKTGENLENMFFYAVADLPYFTQFQWVNKEKLVEELSIFIFNQYY
jgi:GTPase SAR1 family protein